MRENHSPAGRIGSAIDPLACCANNTWQYARPILLWANSLRSWGGQCGNNGGPYNVGWSSQNHCWTTPRDRGHACAYRGGNKMEICPGPTFGQARRCQEAPNENVWIASMVHGHYQEIRSRVPHGASQEGSLLPWETCDRWVFWTVSVIQSRRTRQIYRQLLLSVSDFFL